MRERDKPKPLTTRREKWEHYWHYYKIHTIAGVFFLMMVAITVRDFSVKKKPDVSWGYMGRQMTAEQREALLQELLPLIEDANGDGEKHIRLYPLVIPEQIVAVMTSGDTQLFSFTLESFSGFAKEGAFLPLDDVIAANNIDLETSPEVRLTALETSREHVYGLPLGANRFLKDLGVQLEGTYLALRVSKLSKDPADKIAHENAAAIVKYLAGVH